MRNIRVDLHRMVGHVMSEKDCEFVEKIYGEKLRLENENLQLEAEIARLREELRTRFYVHGTEILVVSEGKAKTVAVTRTGDVRVNTLIEISEGIIKL